MVVWVQLVIYGCYYYWFSIQHNIHNKMGGRKGGRRTEAGQNLWLSYKMPPETHLVLSCTIQRVSVFSWYNWVLCLIGLHDLVKRLIILRHSHYYGRLDELTLCISGIGEPNRWKVVPVNVWWFTKYQFWSRIGPWHILWEFVQVFWYCFLHRGSLLCGKDKIQSFPTSETKIWRISSRNFCIHGPVISYVKLREVRG